jgi:DNA-binding GntR family transcriptional regulator
MNTQINKNSDEVVDLVFEAILKNRLKPGVRLSEISLQEEFGYSRSVVRQGFDKLVDSGLLQHKKNQGVRVACPTREETIQIYEARQAIETAVITILVNKHKSQNLDLSPIDELISEERRLHKDSLYDEHTKLSCDFHLTLAELCDNKYIVESLKPLIPLSTLAASVYSNPESTFCSYAEHHDLVQAIKSNDSNKASESISKHLDHCVKSLDFNKPIRTKSYSNIFR